MEYRGAGLSKNVGDEPWNYYNQVCTPEFARGWDGASPQGAGAMLARCRVMSCRTTPRACPQRVCCRQLRPACLACLPWSSMFCQLIYTAFPASGRTHCLPCACRPRRCFCWPMRWASRPSTGWAGPQAATRGWCWRRCTATGCTAWPAWRAWRAGPTRVRVAGARAVGRKHGRLAGLGSWRGRAGRLATGERRPPATASPVRCSTSGSAFSLPAVVPPAYDMLDPDLSLSVGQTMALIFPPDNPGQSGRSTAGGGPASVRRAAGSRLAWGSKAAFGFHGCCVQPSASQPRYTSMHAVFNHPHRSRV